MTTGGTLMKLKTLSQVVSIGLALMALTSASLAAQSSSLDTCGAPRGREAARAKARLLVEQIRTDLAAVEDQIRDVELVTQVEAGTASVEVIAAVVAEEYTIIRSDLKSFERMAARWDYPGSEFFGGLAFGESLALPLVLDFAETVGLSEADLKAASTQAEASRWKAEDPGEHGPRPRCVGGGVWIRAFRSGVLLLLRRADSRL